MSTIFAKKLRHRYCNLQGPWYSSKGIFPLSICLGDHFVFRISHFNETYVYGYPQACLGSYLASMTEFFCEVWTNLSKFIAKFYLRFVRFNWEYGQWSLPKYLTHDVLRGVEKGCFGNKGVNIIWNCSRRGFIIILSSIIQTLHDLIDLSRFFFLALCDNLVKSLESNTKVHRWL